MMRDSTPAKGIKRGDVFRGEVIAVERKRIVLNNHPGTGNLFTDEVRTSIERIR